MLGMRLSFSRGWGCGCSCAHARVACVLWVGAPYSADVNTCPAQAQLCTPGVLARGCPSASSTAVSHTQACIMQAKDFACSCHPVQHVQIHKSSLAEPDTLSRNSQTLTNVFGYVELGVALVGGVAVRVGSNDGQVRPPRSGHAPVQSPVPSYLSRLSTYSLL